jgi:hypothetical protein
MNKYLNQGYEIWPNYFDANKIDIIKKKLDHYFEKNENLGPAVNVSILKEEELNTYGAERDEVQKKNKNFFIKKEDLDKGVDYYKNLTNGRSLIEPILMIEEIVELVINDKILEFAKKNLNQEEIYIGYIKLRRFFNNKINNFDTNFFHTDDNCEKILKCIIYIDDILTINDGPFVYVSGSHIKKLDKKDGLNEYARKDEDIEKFYGTKNIKPIYGKRGSLLFANTLGYHKGIKPSSKDRYALYINFVCEEEYGGLGPKQKINKKILNRLKDKDKLFKFFEKI